MMFREVPLHEKTKGRLYLHSMPGRHERLEEFHREILETKINLIVCLAEADEIEKKSPSYYQAIKSESIPCFKLDFPIPDYGIPSDFKLFAECVQTVAQRIHSGDNVLLHCAGGIGRTGTFAVCLLHCFGFKQEIAVKIIDKAGSYAERPEQRNLLMWHADIVCRRMNCQ